MKITLPVLFLAVLSIWGCKKDSINTDSSAMLEFSADSILFDTVFTSVGSVTRRIKVFNRGKRPVKISSIKLRGGAASNFQLNINGIASNILSDIELAGNDSLNVFVKVTINPSSERLPFIVKDSIEFGTNGNYQKVILSAFGQNAVFIRDGKIAGNTVWTNTLPYVIYNTLTVEPNTTLSIQKGSRIYFHKDAGMRIAGTLKVLGERLDTVTFASDRLERVYEDEPGQWLGFHFLSSSKENHLNYASISNGVAGIKVDSLSTNASPKLLLTNTIVRNMSLTALQFDNADVAGFNNLILSSGRYLLYAVNGGRYNFKQNTFANIGFQFARTTPSVFFADHSNVGMAREMDIAFINNIIWGNLQEELVVENKGALSFNQAIRKNLIKTKVNSWEAAGNILNADPRFKNTKTGDFSLQSTSPAANAGENLAPDPNFAAWLSKDLNGRVRLFPSDLGSYEVL